MSVTMSCNVLRVHDNVASGCQANELLELQLAGGSLVHQRKGQWRGGAGGRGAWQPSPVSGNCVNQENKQINLDPLLYSRCSRLTTRVPVAGLLLQLCYRPQPSIPQHAAPSQFLHSNLRGAP